tara:strand:+ start:93 stop:461 length:369 start_codon:yes stop_codon:yes gene_type:complete
MYKTPICAFVVGPIKKARSCPNLLHMSEPISPTTVQKEIAVGTVMAITSVILTGNHHHLITLNEVSEAFASETVNILTNLKYERKSIISKLYRLKKIKLFSLVLFLPLIIRAISFTIMQIIF